jgi:immune inhibitor A
MGLKESLFMQPNPNPASALPKIIGIIVAILVCCSCIAIAAAGVFFYRAYQNTPFIPSFENTVTPAPTVEIHRPPVNSVSAETVDILAQAVVPVNNPSQLACQLKGVCDIPATLEPPVAPLAAGDKQKFWAGNVDTNDNFQVDATLQYVTPHVYFWVEDGVSYDQRDLKNLADTFENKIYPTNREFFGSEWSPGIDGDVHIYILYARGLGGSVAGYFSSADEVSPLAHQYSNAHEMFDFNADNTNLGENFTYGVLAHEFQHMIHFAQDPNESLWINEGFSELAAFLNGYDVGGFDGLYLSNPDIQLNDWPNDQNITSPHYGSSFLYLTYFLDRFGEDATKAVVKDLANGFDSIDNALKQINATDPVTNQPVTADDVFMDWAITNYVMDGSVGDGRYVYHNYSGTDPVAPTEAISNCPQSPLTRDVHQYGVDYIEISCSGEQTLHFEGSTATGLLPVSAHSGKYAFWSNKGDESDMTLTREFDFTNVSGAIDFTYYTWYDLEQDYDYLFLEASTDGEHWQIITTPSGTADNPSGNSYGWGYTGKSTDWIQESVDLSEFAGQKVQLRFQYVTDGAVNGEGFLLDDVRVDAISYQSDFEEDDGGWEADGFVRVENVLPQTYRLALVIKGDTTTVTQIELNSDQTADIPLSLKSGEDAILVVTGTTRFTRLPATYQIEIK